MIYEWSKVLQSGGDRLFPKVEGPLSDTTTSAYHRAKAVKSLSDDSLPQCLKVSLTTTTNWTWC